MAGIGKSVLLESSTASAQARVLRVTGVESEAEALRGALGLGGATRGDQFLVGLATLSLLVELSAAGPVLCLVADAQWLDGESADALLFAARRLHTEPSSCSPRGRVSSPRGLPELRLDALDAEAAQKLLAEQGPDLPPAARDQLVAEAGQPARDHVSRGHRTTLSCVSNWRRSARARSVSSTIRAIGSTPVDPMIAAWACVPCASSSATGNSPFRSTRS